MSYGPQLPISEQTHADKYREPGETFIQSADRVAGSLADGSDHFIALQEILRRQSFMPAGRIQSAIGSRRIVTAFNCFVSGIIDDSFTDGSGSIMARATEAAETMRRGGGIGYDFSGLRPRNATIRKLSSSSSGPVSFMRIYNEIGQCVSSAGHRRGAQMGVLRIDHPDIEEFIEAKMNETELRGFNISVGATDEFMNCLLERKPFDLRFGGKVWRTINPHELWEKIMQATWDWAEPGVLFIDRINRMNNLWYCERILATNPCGEQPLPPFGACLLGSFNLVKYVFRKALGWVFDFDRFRRDIKTVVRAMDNVIERTIYPLREQELEAHRKRRMGLGLTGVANAIEAVIGRACYGEPEFLQMLDKILKILANEAYKASAMLAAEKGSFPAFEKDLYLQSKFLKILEDDTIDLIRQHGIRNSHLLSLAPTGTISLTADNISSSIEPVYSYSHERDLRNADGSKQTVVVEDYGHRVFQIDGKCTAQVTIDEHLSVLALAQKWVDSAVSKTCNVSPDMLPREFSGVYIEAWKRGCKGVTTFNAGGKRMGVIRAKEPEQEEAPAEELVVAGPVTACEIDPVTGRRSCE